MKKISYDLFPKPIVITGYILILTAIAVTMLSIFPVWDVFQQENFGGLIAFMIIGIIIVSFRSHLVIDAGSVFKESGLLGIKLSHEKIRIPQDCTGILIKLKIKKGTGYYRFVLPVSYTFKSWDLFLCTRKGLMNLINTDRERAVRIAEFLKSNLHLDYKIEE